MYWADRRPAWLWSADGQTLLWRNAAAHFFAGKIKKSGQRVLADAVPIKGQVNRLIRLGSPGRSSLSRLQFLAGGKPVSATCACTPIEDAEGRMALLIVGVDPVAADDADLPEGVDDMVESILPAGGQRLVVDATGAVLGGTEPALSQFARDGALDDAAPADDAPARIGETLYRTLRFKANSAGAQLLLFVPSGLAEAPSVEPLPPEEPPEANQPSEIFAVFDPGPQPEDESTPPEDAPVPAEPPVPVEEAPVIADQADWHALADLADTPEAEDLPTDGDATDAASEPALPGEAAGTFDPGPQPEDESTPPEDAPVPAEPPAPTEEAPIVTDQADWHALADLADLADTPEAEDLPADGVAADAASEHASPAESDAEPAAAEAPETQPQDRRLSSLFDQLANDAELFTPLRDEEPAPVDHLELDGEPLDLPAEPESPPAAEPDETDDGDASRRMLIRLVGRGFEPLEEPEAPPTSDAAPAESAPPEDEPIAIEDWHEPDDPSLRATLPPDLAAPPDRESVERVSRYNFDELSRILTDRVSGEAPPGRDGEPAETASLPANAATGSLVNLSGETLVLNRLPLGILVFRDQQVLFANRAITEMIGYESVEALRQAGLGAIFPGQDGQEAGPVNHLVQRDGTLVPVTARLQSMSWQGRPALMLSASMTEVRTSHEAAVRAFAESLAATREDGFVEAGKTGVIAQVSPQARLLLGRTEQSLLGKPLSALLDPADVPALKAFLERPARFAETARPAIVLRGAERQTEVQLFVAGQAGIVTGYFGFVRRRGQPGATAPALSAETADVGLLTRLSRGVRRPLNTIIGFADLIHTGAFGPLDNPRYREYAQDIRTAGAEIAALVDELDDYARLQEGRYAAAPAETDLSALLDHCVLRVRGQANGGRVLVRSAISERLPRIRADRPSLTQAVLNLLSSAIDQTPSGGSVVLSAQLEDDGSLSVHVRDGADARADQTDRFVVFRDGLGKDGEPLGPIRSSVGLALTRALLAVNSCTLAVRPAGSVGTLFTMAIPPGLVVLRQQALPTE